MASKKSQLDRDGADPSEARSTEAEPDDQPALAADAVEADAPDAVEETSTKKSRKRSRAKVEIDLSPQDESDDRKNVEEDDDAETPTGASRQSSAEADQADDLTQASADAGEASAASDVDLPLLEALLFSTRSPLTANRLVEMMGLLAVKPLRGAMRELNRQYESTGRCFRVEQVAGGYQLLTQPQFGDVLKRLHQKEIDAKLTKAALETLAIIAYKQPLLRADLEAIRGVACGETIRSLMEKHLVKIAGRAEVPGRPILYGTTKRFLELFGLNTLKDLPQGEAGAPPKLPGPASA